jgi:hypothetical protein
MFLAIVAKQDLEYSHFNIINTFINSHLKEEIYLALPQGIVDQTSDILLIHPSLDKLK